MSKQCQGIVKRNTGNVHLIFPLIIIGDPPWGKQNWEEKIQEEYLLFLSRCKVITQKRTNNLLNNKLTVIWLNDCLMSSIDCCVAKLVCTILNE